MMPSTAVRPMIAPTTAPKTTAKPAYIRKLAVISRPRRPSAFFVPIWVICSCTMRLTAE